jgi:hypothetical protein
MSKLTGKGVELVHLIGKVKQGDGERDSPLPWDGVYKDGKHVANIMRVTGATLCLTVDMLEEEREELHKEVTKLRLATGKFIPKQEGEKITFPVSDAVLAELTGHNEKEDEALAELARSQYGLDEEGAETDLAEEHKEDEE